MRNGGKITKTIAGLVAALSLAGCNVHQQMVPTVKVGKPKPATKFSEYAGALEQLGEMMHAYGQPQFVVMVEPVTDQTASGGILPVDVSLLVESALQNIGERVLLMPYGDSALEAATDEERQIYIVRGAITEFDAATESRNSSGEAGFSVMKLDMDAGVDSGAGFQSGTIAMDFLIQDWKTKTYVPGVKATAKATLEKTEQNRGFNFSILGNGFGLNGSAATQTPVHHVINLMIEYSMVQLIGQTKAYPYWLAMHGADPDYRVMRKIRRKFERMQPNVQNFIISFLLNRLDPSVPSGQEVLTQHTIQRLAAAKRRFGIVPPDGAVTSELYMKLLTDGVSLHRDNITRRKADKLLNSVFE